MNRVRIIGMGSPCGDDRVGWDAVRAIEASGLFKRFPDGAVEACCCERPASLLGLSKDIDAVIMIDAMRGGNAVGTVRRLEASELAAEHGLLSSHGISVAENIALGAALGLLPPILVIYGIEAHGAVPGTEPGQDARAAIPIVRDAVAAELERLFAECVP
jgi:hydrogenase maturation protease